jgi:hypothetical protein
MHWTRGSARPGTVNSVALTDPFSSQPALKSSAVTAQVYKAKMVRLLTSSVELPANTLRRYRADAKQAGRWNWRAQTERLETEARQLCVTGETSSVQTDPTTGIHVRHNGGRQITATLFFAAPNPVVVSRSSITLTRSARTRRRSPSVAERAPSIGQTQVLFVHAGGRPKYFVDRCERRAASRHSQAGETLCRYQLWVLQT